jgi:hypothetical protein
MQIAHSISFEYRLGQAQNLYNPDARVKLIEHDHLVNSVISIPHIGVFSKHHTVHGGTAGYPDGAVPMRSRRTDCPS